MKPRPQVVVNQLIEVNKYLERNNVKSESDPVFTFFQFWLLENKYYHGFNFYVHDTFGGVPCLRLAGSACSAGYDCLQFI